VGGPEAFEPVPFDDAREASPLARADDIYILDRVEELDREDLSLGDPFGGGLLADLAR